MIELSKYKEGKEIDSDWIKFIKESPRMVDLDKFEKEVQEAIKELDYLEQDPAMREIVKEKEDALREKVTILYDARQAEKNKEETKRMQEEIKKSKEEIKEMEANIEKSKEEIKKSKEEMKKSKEEMKKSKEEMKKSKEEIEKSKEEMKRKEEEYIKKKIQLIMNMYNENMTIEYISKLTNIPKEEVEEIIKNI